MLVCAGLMFVPRSLQVCLLDEYSSEEKCAEMAEECYGTYRKEKCVERIRACLHQDSHVDHGDCVAVAQSCLYEEEEEKVHQDCVQQIPLCLPYNTEVIKSVLCTPYS